MSLFGSLKDKAVAASVKAFLNRKIANIGEVTDFQFDNERRTVSLVLQLKGELSPIQAEAEGYELSEANGQHFIALTKLRASREWLTILLQEHIAGRRFPVPPALRSAL